MTAVDKNITASSVVRYIMLICDISGKWNRNIDHYWVT